MKMIYVTTGDVIVTSSDVVLASTPLGSCVAVSMYDTELSLGGMAHVMLPRCAPLNETEGQNKYAYQAVHELVRSMLAKGSEFSRLQICLAGGANVLKHSDNSLVRSISESISEYLSDLELSPVTCSLGGTERRCVELVIPTGALYCRIGNSPKELLWDFYRHKSDMHDLKCQKETNLKY